LRYNAIFFLLFSIKCSKDCPKSSPEKRGIGIRFYFDGLICLDSNLAGISNDKVNAKRNHGNCKCVFLTGFTVKRSVDLTRRV
jgi:hypothetical protein